MSVGSGIGCLTTVICAGSVHCCDVCQTHDGHQAERLFEGIKIRLNDTWTCKRLHERSACE